MIGLGGGVILTPLWLEMNFPNNRAQATSIFTVIFTSFSSFFTNYIAGKYIYKELIFWGLISLVSSFVVAKFLNYLV